MSATTPELRVGSARATGSSGFTAGELALGAALAMVAGHVVLRVAMLWPSWFYGDDFALLGQAATTDLADPYAGQLMPLGRLLALVVADAGPLDWHTAALTVLVLVVLADVACVWMLVELFGPRWGILLPLAGYLTTAVVMPATMWWAAALNQQPLQIVLFAAVAAWVRYLRTGRARWWVLAGALLAVGLLAYVKVLLVLGVLVWIALAHFASGGPWHRVRTVARDHGRALAVLGAGAAAYVVWFAATVPSIVTADRSPAVAGDLASTMLGRALPVGLLGGPWRWSPDNRPVAPADPPDWSVALAWVALVVIGVALAARRRRTGRVWGLLLGYTASTYVLLLATRSPLVGGVIGLEYRYLTDVAPVVALCLGLATMTLLGAVEPTERRGSPPPGPVRPLVPVLLGTTLAVSGLVSSVGYARLWHDDNPTRPWFDQARAGLTAAGAVEVADRAVPADVVSPLVAPWNTLGRLLPLAGLEVSFDQVSARPALLDATGAVRQGIVAPEIRGVPGPQPGCGYRLDGGSVTVPLEREVPRGVYWMRVGYLAATADTVTVTSGGVTGQEQVSKGLGSIFVDLAGGADAVTVTVGDGTALCVGDVEVGPLVEGGAW